MLYHLLYPLASDIGALNVVRYITFRTGAATLTALFISFLVGPLLLRKLASLRVEASVLEAADVGDDEGRHQSHQGHHRQHLDQRERRGAARGAGPHGITSPGCRRRPSR